MAGNTEQVRRVVRDCFSTQLAGVELEDDWDLIEMGFINSFELVNLVMALEQNFGGIRIPDSDATKDNLGSVNSISAYLEGRGI